MANQTLLFVQGAAESGQKIANLPAFTSSLIIKVNPDKPQEEVRFLALQVNIFFYNLCWVHKIN